MALRRSRFWTGLTIVIGAIVLVLALPQSVRSSFPILGNPTLHFGLDLAGGTQLDFRISEQEMREQIASLDEQIANLRASGVASDEQIFQLEQQRDALEDQQENIVEAIRTVLERRINALGVSEAVITPSYLGGEKHLLVECPGVVDTQECIRTVGKTITLEFKEQQTEADENFEAQIRAKADAAFARITESGETLEVVGQDLGDDLGLSYSDSQYFFRDQLPDGLDSLWNAQVSDRVYLQEATVEVSSQNETGEPTTEEVPGIFLSQVLHARTQTGRLITNAPDAFSYLASIETSVTNDSYTDRVLGDAVPLQVVTALRGMKGGELRSVAVSDTDARLLFLRRLQLGQDEMEASHVLISYAGATSAPDTVTRSKEEALARAIEIKSRIDSGEDFAALARQYSDGLSASDGGSLGAFNRQAMVPSFSSAAFQMVPGQVSDPVETAFGYHVIRADSAPRRSLDVASYEELIVSGEEAATRSNSFLSQLRTGLERPEDAIALRTLFFSLLPTGWKDTQLDGKHFQSATVTLDPVTNIPVVQVVFDEEGGDLFGEITKRNVGKPIAIFVGGQLVSAPTVQTEITGGSAVITGVGTFENAKQLAQDLNTGAIPAPIYLVGQRTVEATLGAEALSVSVQAALVGIVLLMVYMVAYYRLLGLLADIALAAYALLFLAILKLPLFLFSDNYIVLSLAGMAGIILSIGMAVDANVLIFERLREELRKGKSLRAAAETGFSRAWPSIRDGNISTLITCFILFTVGTSIVRGFAVTLGFGVLLSMFSAIVVTRWLIAELADRGLGERKSLL